MADTAVEAPPVAMPQPDLKDISTESEAKTSTQRQIGVKEVKTDNEAKATVQTHAENVPNGQAQDDDAPSENRASAGRGGYRGSRGRGRGGRHQGNKKFDRHDNHHSKSHDGRQNGYDRSKHGRYQPKGNRSRLEVEEKSDDPVQIRKQVEFYFSDSNLPADKFLFGLVGGHENKPVPVATIHNFRRMRHFQPFSAVVNALKESSFLDIVEVEKMIEPERISKGVEGESKSSDVKETTEGVQDSKAGEDKAVKVETLEDAENTKDKSDKSEASEVKTESGAVEDAEDENGKAKASNVEICVKRKEPLAAGTTTTQSEIMQVFANAAMARSVYVKGFGEENAGTQFDIEAWFSEFGPTNAVRLRRTDDGTFKGSVFVEFDSEETAKKFLAIDPQPKYRNRNLLIKGKKQYHDDQIAEMNEGRMRVDGTKSRDVRNRDWRDMREEDRKKGFPPLADGSYGSTKASTNKRSREDLKEEASDERAAKKVDIEGAAGADKNDENITDAPPSEEKPDSEEEKIAETEQNAPSSEEEARVEEKNLEDAKQIAATEAKESEPTS